MTNAKKSLITIKMVDLFGNPIAKLEYQVKNQRSGEVIAAGPTNSAGCIVEISRDKGTVIDVYIKNMFTGKMGKVQSFVMSRDRMLVKITSPKVLLDLKTLLDQGSGGQYKRKTHTVKQGETLTSIASKNHTTVRALERLNKIDDPNKIHIGQVLKLPVDIPATGSNAHQDKPKPPTTSTKPKVAPKTQTPKVSNKTTPQSKESSGVLGTLGDLGNQALEQANDLYEEGKKTFNDAVGSVTKILTVDDRSQEGGTPKSNAPNLCKTNPQCIDKGSSELIREVNIRLVGFGGAIPTSEFTELTAKCIKQFQRDYMGVPETGKICGSLLVALDKFYYEYKIGDFFTDMTCNKCHQCSGFGKGRKGVYTLVSYNRNTGSTSYPKVDLWEPPGLHRPLIWLYKAIQFYMKKEGGYKVVGISSGYRCVDENLRVKRSSINHMGCALDILVADKNGTRVTNQALQDKIRVAIVQKYTNSAFDWAGPANRANMESYQYGAKTWLHIDTRKFDSIYKTSDLFSKTIEGLNGELLVNIAKTKGLDKVLACAGTTLNTQQSQQNTSNVLELTKQDLDDILKVAATEVRVFKNNETMTYQQMGGVIETILNRRMTGRPKYSTIRKVLNESWAFSDINTPRKSAYGSAQNVPWSRVTQGHRDAFEKYINDRVSGKASIIGSELHYANPTQLGEASANTKKWVADVVKQAQKTGYIFGRGDFIHYHGTTSDGVKFKPKPFNIKLV
jgi:hypothetical protein